MIYTPHPNFPRTVRIPLRKLATARALCVNTDIFAEIAQSHDSHTPNSITTLNPTTKVNHNGSSSLPCMKQQFYVPPPFPCMYVAM